jgi:hypothetical protein
MDLLCFDDLNEFALEIEDPIEILIQDIVHMLLESYGSNVDSSYRSIGLDDYLSGQPDPSMKTLIENKLLKDARISAAEVELNESETGVYDIDMKIVVDEQEIGISLTYDGAGNLVRNP